MIAAMRRTATSTVMISRNQCWRTSERWLGDLVAGLLGSWLRGWWSSWKGQEGVSGVLGLSAAGDVFIGHAPVSLSPAVIPWEFITLFVVA